MSEPQWFVTNGQWRRGPMNLDGLVEELMRTDAPGQLLVWQEGMDGWTQAYLVSEVAVRLPPPLPATAPAVAPEPSVGTAQPISLSDSPTTRRCLLCGLINPGSAQRCDCGYDFVARQRLPPQGQQTAGSASGAAQMPWFMVGTTKLVAMSVVTFGLYEIYWFYQHWQRVRTATGEKIQPALRALFGVIFCHSLFKRIAESARAAGLEPPTATGNLSGAFILLTITWRLPDPFWLITFLSVLPLVAVQRLATAVTLRHAPGADPNARLTPANWVGVVLGGLLFVLAVVGMLLPENLLSQKPSSQAFLSKVAGEVNKTLPKTLDEETELLETVGLEGTLVYYYRLVNYSTADLNPQKLEAALRPNLTRQACTTPQTRDGLLKHGVTLRHIYRDRNRVDVVTIEIRPRDCGF